MNKCQTNGRNWRETEESVDEGERGDLKLNIFSWVSQIFWEIGMHIKKQQLELDMEQQTTSKLGKE